MKIIERMLLSGKHTCPWWLAYAWDHRLRKLIHDPQRMLKPYLSEGDNAADIGCGMGYFSIALAHYVGPSGRVFAVDIQPRMLDILIRRARKRNVHGPIVTILAGDQEQEVDAGLDFMLTFWMLHEVDDKAAFLRRWYASLKPTGKYLLVEPVIHVSRQRFRAEVDLCRHIGFESLSRPAVGFSRAMLFEKS